MATAVSPEVQLMRRRVRHIHIPDLPPIYAPRSLPGAIRDHIEEQITRQRAIAEQPQPDRPNYGFAKPTSNVPLPLSFESWVKRAGPPPTVLSFTRRPTYILPKHQVARQEQWQVDYLTKALKSRMNVHFPEPPGWSSLPWRPFWEREMAPSGWKHDPLNHQWPGVGVLIMPCAEAMFLGPGQVSMWPIMDLQDDIQRGTTKLQTKYDFERILEDTTIEILKREFGIQAFAIPGSTGVWVESRIPPPEFDEGRSEADGFQNPQDGLGLSARRGNVRRIATVHASITDDITQWGVSIHVGQPDPTADSWTRSTNPWIPLRQHNTTTSIAAELCHMKSSASPLGPSKYLFTHFDQNSLPARAGSGAIPYSLIKADQGRRSPAPLGMDNRDISTAWTYEFARQLGMRDGHVDHYSMVDAVDSNTASLPTKASGAGFRFKGVFSEDVMNSSYRQVDVPHILVGRYEKASPGIVEESMRVEHADQRIDSDVHDGWFLSWPLWRTTLFRKLDEAIRGGPCDTRKIVHGMHKQLTTRLQRRRNELQQVKKVEDEWRADMPHLVRRPLTDDIIRELAERSREMESILKTVRMGTKSEKLLDSTIQIRRLLERRFAGAFARDAVDTKTEQSDSSSALEAAATQTEQSDPFSALEAASGAADTGRIKGRARSQPPRRSLRFVPPETDAKPLGLVRTPNGPKFAVPVVKPLGLARTSNEPEVAVPVVKPLRLVQTPIGPENAVPESSAKHLGLEATQSANVQDGLDAQNGQSSPVPPPQVTAGEPADPTETKPEKRFTERGTVMPYEFTKTNTKRYEERLAERARRRAEHREKTRKSWEEARKAAAELMRTGPAPRAGGASQFLPRTNQIGGP